TLATNDWFLDLNPNVGKTIPPDKIPSFLVTASGNATTAIVNVSANVQFRPQDVGKSIFIFAYSPAAITKGASLEKGTQDCVLSQLDPNGQPVSTSASGLGAAVTNVTNSQSQAVNALSNILATNVSG